MDTSGRLSNIGLEDDVASAGRLSTVDNKTLYCTPVPQAQSTIAKGVRPEILGQAPGASFISEENCESSADIAGEPQFKLSFGASDDFGQGEPAKSDTSSSGKTGDISSSEKEDRSSLGILDMNSMDDFTGSLMPTVAKELRKSSASNASASSTGTLCDHLPVTSPVPPTPATLTAHARLVPMQMEHIEDEEDLEASLFEVNFGAKEMEKMEYEFSDDDDDDDMDDTVNADDKLEPSSVPDVVESTGQAAISALYLRRSPLLDKMKDVPTRIAFDVDDVTDDVIQNGDCRVHGQEDVLDPSDEASMGFGLPTGDTDTHYNAITVNEAVKDFEDDPAADDELEEQFEDEHSDYRRQLEAIVNEDILASGQQPDDGRQSAEGREAESSDDVTNAAFPLDEVGNGEGGEMSQRQVRFASLAEIHSRSLSAFSSDMSQPQPGLGDVTDEVGNPLLDQSSFDLAALRARQLNAEESVVSDVMEGDGYLAEDLSPDHNDMRASLDSGLGQAQGEEAMGPVYVNEQGVRVTQLAYQDSFRDFVAEQEQDVVGDFSVINDQFSDGEFGTSGEAINMIDNDEAEFEKEHKFELNSTVSKESLLPHQQEAWSLHSSKYADNTGASDDLRVSIGAFLGSRTHALGSLDGAAEERPQFGSSKLRTPPQRAPRALVVVSPRPSEAHDVTGGRASDVHNATGEMSASHRSSEVCDVTGGPIVKPRPSLVHGGSISPQRNQLRDVTSGAGGEKEEVILEASVDREVEGRSLDAEELCAQPTTQHAASSDNSTNDVSFPRSADCTSNLSKEASSYLLNISAIAEAINQASVDQRPSELADMIMRMSHAKHQQRQAAQRGIQNGGQTTAAPVANQRPDSAASSVSMASSSDVSDDANSSEQPPRGLSRSGVGEEEEYLDNPIRRPDGHDDIRPHPRTVSTSPVAPFDPVERSALPEGKPRQSDSLTDVTSTLPTAPPPESNTSQVSSNRSGLMTSEPESEQLEVGQSGDAEDDSPSQPLGHLTMEEIQRRLVLDKEQMALFQNILLKSKQQQRNQRVMEPQELTPEARRLQPRVKRLSSTPSRAGGGAAAQMESASLSRISPSPRDGITGAVIASGEPVKDDLHTDPEMSEDHGYYKAGKLRNARPPMEDQFNMAPVEPAAAMATGVNKRVSTASVMSPNAAPQLTMMTLDEEALMQQQHPPRSPPIKQSRDVCLPLSADTSATPSGLGWASSQPRRLSVSFVEPRMFKDAAPPMSVWAPHELEIPDVCCVGLSVDAILPLTNNSDSWLQLDLQVVCSSLDGQLERMDSVIPFVVLPKQVLEPHKTEEIKVIFAPRQAGECSAELRIIPKQTPSPRGGISPVVNPPICVTLRGVAEEPNVRILQQAGGKLDFGALPWGSAKSLPIVIVNSGRAKVPVRLSVFSGNAAFSCFSLEQSQQQQQDSTLDSTPTFNSVRQSVCNHVVPGVAAGAMLPQQVSVYFRAPKTKDHKVKSSGPAEIFTARVELHLDVPRSAPLDSIDVIARVGSARIHLHKDVCDEVRFRAKNRETCRRVVPMRNVGNIPLEVTMEVTHYPDNFSVQPASQWVQPGETKDVEVVFKPGQVAPCTLNSFLSLAVDPDGPTFEVRLLGEVLPVAATRPASRDRDILLTNRNKLCWGAVALHAAQEKSVTLKNVTAQSLSISLQITDDPLSEFQLAGSRPNRVDVRAGDDYIVHIRFRPQQVAPSAAKLRIRVATDGAKYVIPLTGHGGTSRLEVCNLDIGSASGHYVAHLGSVKRNQKVMTKIVVTNRGQRTAFLKAIAFADSTCKIRLKNELVVEPDEFCIKRGHTKTVIAVLTPSKREEDLSRVTSSEVAAVALVSGDDFSRSKFRRAVRKTGLQTLDAKHALADVNFDRTFADEERFSDDSAVSDEDIRLFYAGLTRTTISLIGNPSIYQTPLLAKQRNYHTGRGDVSVTTDEDSVQSDNINRNGNHVPHATAKSDWSVEPSSVVLHADAKQSEQPIRELRIANFSPIPMRFEFSWPAHMLCVTPEEGVVPSMDSVRICVSGHGSLATRRDRLPWKGDLRVTCFDQIKDIPVQIHRTIVAETRKSAFSQVVGDVRPRPVSTVTSLPTNLTAQDRVAISVNLLDFRALKVGTEEVQKFSISNRSSVAAEVLVSVPDLPFTVKHKKPITIGKRCMVKYPVYFRPKLSGFYQSEVVVTVKGEGQGQTETFTVALRGTAI